jgi:plastocyanin
MDRTFTTMAAPRLGRVSALGRLNAAALAGVALALGYLGAAFLGVDPVGITAIVLCLGCAGLTLTGWRWAPLPGLLPGVALPALFGSFLLADPGAGTFLPGLLLVACGALVGLSGVAAAIQNYRRPAGDRPLPRWIIPAALLLAGLAIGAELVALAPRPAAGAGVSPEVLRTLPGMAGRDFSFSQAELHVKAGETVALRLENGDPATHWFEVDELGVHAEMPVGQTGVALFRPTKPGTYTFYCSPHFDKASGQGMHGTLIVEP